MFIRTIKEREYYNLENEISFNQFFYGFIIRKNKFYIFEIVIYSLFFFDQVNPTEEINVNFMRTTGKFSHTN